jgi:hypothetical protein
VIEATRLREVNNAHRRARKRMTDEINGGLSVITDPHPQKLIINAVRHGESLSASDRTRTGDLRRDRPAF